ncbi:MAG: YhcH/YjgK/YiaL family protein [Prolixibacteraceae bacterium]|jgi:YhcH/YjgK/YiaL family protein|nr:YhcH/YjgK/YiaL family protein [Prolixibacteraceae bacterium]
MVLDSIENAARYLNMGDGIAKALHYIQNNDFSAVQPGRYQLEGDRLVMLVFEFEAVNTDECRLEGHRKYIDLQYWETGSELMGHEILGNQPVLEPYNEKTDCAFYNCIASFSRLLPGMFVIYYPSDLHTANSDPLSKERVKKLVFKILIE